MTAAERKLASQPDSSRTFGHGRVELFGIGGGVVRRFTLQPGWRWSQDMGPIAKTEWCEASHFQYQMSGQLHVLLEDGTEFDLRTGDLAILPSGHDTWVVGNEPVVLVDWYRASHLAVGERVKPITSDDALPGSERMFQALVASTLDFITLVNARGELLFVAPSVERILGWRPADLKGHRIFDFVHPGDAESLKAAFDRALTQRPGETLFEELRFRTRDGSFRRLEVIGNNRLADPAVAGIVVAARDVTERRKAQEKIHRSERRLRDLVMNMPVLLAAASADFTPLAWNKECERVTGRTAKEIVSNPRAVELLVPEATEREALTRRLREVGTDSRSFEMNLTRRDGAVRTVAWSSLAGRYSIPGWPIWAVGRDVTAERHATHALIEASRLSAASALAGGVAKAIRDLVTTVQGNASLLLVSAQDLDARQSLTDIAKAATEAAKLAEQLLAYARGGQVRPRPTTLNEAVTDTVDSNRDSVLRREISVGLDLDPELALIESDPAQLRQLIGILVANAAQAIAGPGRITLRTRSVVLPAEDPEAPRDLAPGAYVRLSVHDTGCGMDAKTKARAFEPFFSTKSTLGLGLPAAQGIVQSQRGAIVPESRVGEGSTFTVYLPARPAP